MARLYALAGLARSGATRSNDHGPAGFVTIGGVAIGTAPDAPGQKIVGNVTITDVLNQTPNRCTFRVRGLVPHIGQAVRVTMGSQATADPLFAGQILNTTHVYVGSPLNYAFDVSAIDWTWGLNQRLLSHRWQTVSATTIAHDILAIGAPGYSGAAVAAGLPVLDEFTVTDLPVTTALTNLATRIGGYWYVDYQKVLHLFVGDDPASPTPPTPLTADHPTLTDLTIDRDGSQLVTRVGVEGGGSACMVELPTGETLLPVATISWYDAAGGVVKSGPQRITYGGIVEGGTGALVGPGAFPSVGVAADLAPGAGVIELGVHGYAITYQTAGGESLPGPVTAIAVGPLGPPAVAPTIAPPSVGATGPDPGVHEWAVAFLTPTGETLPGPRVSAATGLSIAPATPPTAALAAGTGLPVPASLTYGVTFVTPAGETEIGPLSGAVVTTPINNAPAPGMAGNGPSATTGDLIPGHRYAYGVCWSTASGSTTHTEQTTLSDNTMSVVAQASTINPAKSSHILIDVPYGPLGVQWCHLYRVDQTAVPDNNISDMKRLASFANSGPVGTAVRFVDTSADATGPSAISGNTAKPIARVALATIPKGGSGSGVTGRRIYRRTGAGPLKRVTTIADNSTTTFTDAVPDASLGAAPPAPSSAHVSQFLLEDVPRGGPLVTGRRIYRTAAGASTLRLVATIADVITDEYLDTTPDSALGAAPPGTSTAIAQTVQLSAISKGVADVLARRIYRTAADDAALRLLATLADNTTTTYLDTAPDSALGAAAPTADLSGLRQPEGAAVAGADTLPVSGAGWARPEGGWVVIGNGQQVIRYTALVGNALTGIPPTGPGAITATISYNSSVTAAAMLTGIPASGPGAIVYPLQKGDDVNLWEQVDDLDAQALVAALFSAPPADVHSGILEELLQDRRLSAVEARARGAAHLALRRDIAIRVRYRSRDMNTRSGRLVTIDLPASPYNLSASFIIQSVRVHDFTPALLPQCDVEASSTRFSFEDLLRRLSATADSQKG